MRYSHRSCIPGYGRHYVVLLGVIEVEGDGGITDDLLGELHCHEVGVVGGLDDTADDESGNELGQHD
jgi:hypothetical protein